MSDNEISDSDLICGKKRKQKGESMREVIKKSKIQGRSHINHVGKYVPARTTGSPCR